MSWIRYGWKVLLKCKVFVLSLQTADQGSDSPSCLAASCFKAVWTLGLCGKSEGSNSRAVMQTGVTAFAQIHFLALAGLLIRCCYAGIVLFLICLWPAKGPSASVSLTPRQALWAPHYSFQEESIAIPLLRPQRAELTCLCQSSYWKVRAQSEGLQFLTRYTKHDTTTVIQYFLNSPTFYLFWLKQQSLCFLPFKFSLLLAHREWDRPDVAMGLGNLEVGSLVHQFQWLCCAHFTTTSSILTLILAEGSTWFLHFQIYQFFSAFCYYSREMGVGMWYSAKCQGLFLESWQHRCFICTRAIRMRHSYSKTLAETDRHSSCHRETGRLTVAKPWNIWHVFCCPSFVELYLKFYKYMRILVLCFLW